MKTKPISPKALERIPDLRNRIRYGLEANNPSLLGLWFEQDLPLVAEREALSEHYESQFRLLLDTITDDLVPSHWRRSCLDQMYQPLWALRNLCDGEESERRLRGMYSELLVCCKYFEAGLTR